MIDHCITKMNYLHFGNCEIYRKRVIQLGKEPERVFNFGDVGVENIMKMKLMDKKILEKKIRLLFGYAVWSGYISSCYIRKRKCFRVIRRVIGGVKRNKRYKIYYYKTKCR